MNLHEPPQGHDTRQQPYSALPPRLHGRPSRGVSSRKALLLYASILIGACVILYGAALAIEHAQKTPLPPGWSTTQTFYSTSTKQGITDGFTVGNHWRLSWWCAAKSTQNTLLIDVRSNTTGNKLYSHIVVATCQAGGSSGVSEVKSGTGDIFLDVTSKASWTVEVQEQG